MYVYSFMHPASCEWDDVVDAGRHGVGPCEVGLNLFLANTASPVVALENHRIFKRLDQCIFHPRPTPSAVLPVRPVLVGEETLAGAIPAPSLICAESATAAVAYSVGSRCLGQFFWIAFAPFIAGICATPPATAASVRCVVAECLVYFAVGANPLAVDHLPAATCSGRPVAFPALPMGTAPPTCLLKFVATLDRTRLNPDTASFAVPTSWRGEV